MPQEGWECFEEVDLGDLSGSCDLCNTTLRFEFHIHHRDWGPMCVGTDCCDRLTGTTTASEFVDAITKRQDKKRRFIESPQWNDHLGVLRWYHGGVLVAIVKIGTEFVIRCCGVEGNDRFASSRDAKGHVFEMIESGKLDKFASRYSRRIQRGHFF
jgi:hypothetical protein